MRTKEVKEFRELSPEELVKKELEFRDELFVLQMRRAASPLENSQRIQAVKKSVARIQTIVREQKKGEA